ncbi:copper amine oxidase N-terminal domain-containing protein [Anaerotignum faecicola]|nr:copper amine oxidase N-terminal domain-containing protein [Anaerotignum faecicola]
MKNKLFKMLAMGMTVMSMCTPAFAMEPVNADGIHHEESIPERYLEYGSVTKLNYEGEELKSIEAEGVKGNVVVYNISGETVFLDSGEKVKTDASEIKEGDGVYFYHSPIMTMSLPPQTPAEAVVINIPMDAGCANLVTVENVSKSDDGIYILTDNGGLYISVGADASVTLFENGNKASIDEIKEGMRIFAWYDSIMESYPAQTYTNNIVILPEKDTADDEIAPVSETASISIETEGNSHFVPLREVCGKLGLELGWNADTETASIQSDTRAMEISEGDTSFVSFTTIKGAVGMTAPITSDEAVYINENGKMYVPAKIFETLVGYDVEINGGTAVISKRG